MVGNRKSKEMWEFGQRMMSQYAEESDDLDGIKHTRTPLHEKISQGEFQESLDEARQLSSEIIARADGAIDAGTEYYCLSCESGYDRPAGKGYDQICPYCPAEHCDP